MLVGLLTAFLIFSGGNGLAARMFGKDTQALVRRIVIDQERAATATRTLKQGENDLEVIAKEFETIAKAFTKADEAQSAGLEVLTPFMRQASEKRRILQAACLDRMFELRQTLTAEEWSEVVASLK